MSRPRVYLCGAVDKLPDLGVGWRREVAAELVEAGCEPVWPTVDLDGICDGVIDSRFARMAWINLHNDWFLGCGHARPPIDDCLRRLANCDAVFVRWCADVGPGTRAEIAYAVAIGLPVVVWVEGSLDDYAAARRFRSSLDAFYGVSIQTMRERVEYAADASHARVAERERLRQEAGA